MRDVATGQSQDLNLAQFPIRWFCGDQQPQSVERRIHAAWRYKYFDNNPTKKFVKTGDHLILACD